YDIERAGTYGTLYLNSSTGAYMFDPNDAAINARSSNITEEFVLIATDGSASDTTTLVIDITAAPEAAGMAQPDVLVIYDEVGDPWAETLEGTLTTGAAGPITFSVGGQGSDSIEGFDASVDSTYGRLYLN